MKRSRHVETALHFLFVVVDEFKTWEDAGRTWKWVMTSDYLKQFTKRQCPSTVRVQFG